MNFQRLAPTDRRKAFTLIEVIIVVVMIAVLTAMAAFSFAGFGDDLSVKGPSDELIRLAKTAVRSAAIQGRPFTITFGEKDFTLNGWEGRGGNTVALPEGTKLSILRWGQKDWQPAEGQTWMFGGNSPISRLISSGTRYLASMSFLACSLLMGVPSISLISYGRSCFSTVSTLAPMWLITAPIACL